MSFVSQPRRRPRLQPLRLPAVLAVLLVLASCGGKKQARNEAPPPPPPAEIPIQPAPQPKPTEPAESARKNAPGQAIYTQEGYASWYGPGFHNRRTSNGEVFDMNAMTAAHRDFPLNSVVRVTNEKTGHSVVVRITDRVIRSQPHHRPLRRSRESCRCLAPGNCIGEARGTECSVAHRPWRALVRADRSDQPAERCDPFEGTFAGEFRDPGSDPVPCSRRWLLGARKSSAG